MKITCLDQDGKKTFRRTYDIGTIAVDLPNNTDFLNFQRTVLSHINDNEIHQINTDIQHDQLNKIQIAAENTYYGHITNIEQSIYGDKTFYGYSTFVDGFLSEEPSIIAPNGDIYGYVATGVEGLEILNALSGSDTLLKLSAGLVDAGGGTGENALLTTFITYTVTGAGYLSNTYHIKLETTDPMTYTFGAHYGVFASLTGTIVGVTCFYANANSGYAFYGANGNIYNNGDIDITGVYKIGGVTISGGNVFTMYENTFLSVNYFNDNTYFGTTASPTDFPNAQIIASHSDTGHSYSYNIGGVGEAVATYGEPAVGWGGVAKASGVFPAYGIAGRALVSYSTTSGAAVGVEGLSEATHAGGSNIAFYAIASNGMLNYSFYGNSGNIYNAGNANITGYISTSAISTTNLLTTYLSTAYLSATNFLTSYFTATNIYCSTITTTGNIYCGASLTAVQTIIAQAGIQLDSGERIGYGTTGAAPSGGLSFNTSNDASFTATLSAVSNITVGRTAGEPSILLRRVGTAGAAVASGNVINHIYGAGYNGSGYINCASIYMNATENHAVGSSGARIVVQTTANATASLTQRWVFENDGNLLPYTTGAYSLGTSTYRVYNGYFSNDIFTPMISSTNMLTTYLTSTNVYTTYITTTNIYTSTLTATSNVSVSGKVTAASGSFGGTSDYSNFEADGTYVMYGSATVYNDLQYQILTGKVSSANYPVLTTFNTDFEEYLFSTDDLINLGSNELPHSWKEGSLVEFHVHWSNQGALVSGDAVVWEIKYTYANMTNDGTTGTSITFTPTSTISGSFITGLGGVSALKNMYTSIGTATFTNMKIGSQLKIRLKRLPASGAYTDPIDDVYALQVGVHIIEDTIGSRAASTK